MKIDTKALLGIKVYQDNIKPENILSLISIGLYINIGSIIWAKKAGWTYAYQITSREIKLVSEEEAHIILVVKAI